MVSELVVDSFEVVEIDVSDGEHAGMALGAAALALQQFIKGTPVGHAGERIDARQLFFAVEAETKLQLGLHLASQSLQRILLARIQFAGYTVENADGAQSVTAIGSEDGSGSVKADLGFLRDQLAQSKTLIVGGIVDHKELILP